MGEHLSPTKESSMFKVTANGREISFTFRHEHFTVPIEIRTNGPLVKAQTTASLDNGRGTVLYDWSYCAVGDNFNKELGRKVALTKALKHSDLTKDERAAVWNRYHNRQFDDAEYEDLAASLNDGRFDAWMDQWDGDDDTICDLRESVGSSAPANSSLTARSGRGAAVDSDTSNTEWNEIIDGLDDNK